MYERPLIVVDVQPAYAKYIRFDIGRLMALVNTHPGPVLMLYNGNDHARNAGRGDDREEVMAFWKEQGLAREDLVVEAKGYGFFRAYLDEKVSKAAIVRILKTMMAEDVSHAQDFGERLVDLVTNHGRNRKAWKGSWMYWEAPSLHWQNYELLKAYDGALLCGGEKTKCLREVELLMDAMGLGCERHAEFIYDDRGRQIGKNWDRGADASPEDCF